MNFELDEENFVIFAIRHYDNPSCLGVQEFNDDLKRFKYLIRLFRKHQAGKGLKERLILNHLIVIYNLFGVEAATKMLFFKIQKKHWAKLKTFLVFLNFMPEKVSNLLGVDISMDQEIINCLRKI